MTLDQLLEQFREKFISICFDGEDSFEQIEAEPQEIEDWLRTHISEMVKEAVGEEKQDIFYSPGEVEIYNSIVRNILRAEILQTLGIEK